MPSPGLGANLSELGDYQAIFFGPFLQTFSEMNNSVFICF